MDEHKEQLGNSTGCVSLFSRFVAPESENSLSRSIPSLIIGKLG